MMRMGLLTVLMGLLLVGSGMVQDKRPPKLKRKAPPVLRGWMSVEDFSKRTNIPIRTSKTHVGRFTLTNERSFLEFSVDVAYATNLANAGDKTSEIWVGIMIRQKGQGGGFTRGVLSPKQVSSQIIGIQKLVENPKLSHMEQQFFTSSAGFKVSCSSRGGETIWYLIDVKKGSQPNTYGPIELKSLPAISNLLIKAEKLLYK